jgi:hypothetical protein
MGTQSRLEIANAYACDKITCMEIELAAEYSALNKAQDLLRDYYATHQRYIAEKIDYKPNYINTLIQVAINRAYSNNAGFILLMENELLSCAIALSRMQFDSAMRLNALSLVDDANDLAGKILRDERINTEKDRDGHFLQDRYLAEQLQQSEGTNLDNYKYSCGIIHLSGIYLDGMQGDLLNTEGKNEIVFGRDLMHYTNNDRINMMYSMNVHSFLVLKFCIHWIQRLFRINLPDLDVQRWAVIIRNSVKD